ncbi:MAG: riboflavin synthase, partial [Gemmatimonadaceae bacterium]
TVRECGDDWFTVAAVTTTAGRTTIGEWEAGKQVNLERAMKADGRFGGHIVQGHVDTVGTVLSVQASGDALLVDVEVIPGIAQSLVPLGSVTLDGVSLTVNAIAGNVLQVSLIEYTLHHTALAQLKEGSRVHIESDIIGKYVRQMIVPYLNR